METVITAIVLIAAITFGIVVTATGLARFVFDVLAADLWKNRTVIFVLIVLGMIVVCGFAYITLVQ